LPKPIERIFSHFLLLFVEGRAFELVAE